MYIYISMCTSALLSTLATWRLLGVFENGVVGKGNLCAELIYYHIYNGPF